MMTRITWTWLFAALLAAGCGGNGEGEGDADAGDAPGDDMLHDQEAEGADPDVIEEGEGEISPEILEEDGREEEGAPLGQLGDPCTLPTECEGGFCITDAIFPGFEEGYCTTLMCDTADPDSCGPDGACLDLGGGYPTACVRLCDTAGDCAEGQDCTGMCLPGSFVSEPSLPGVLEPGDSIITAVVDAVDEDRMRGRLEILSGVTPWESPGGPVTISSRATAHPAHAYAVDYLEAEMTGIGLTVVRLEFDHVEGHFINIEGTLTGAGTGLAPVYVSAHYDSTAKRTTDWQAATDPAPGASDNGSGSVILLDIAEILVGLAATSPSQRDVVFVLFDAEELGLYGSAEYAQDLASAGSTVLCDMNVDMVGWDPALTPGRFWYVYDAADEARAAFGLEAIAIFVPEAIPIPSSLSVWANSDHSSFWDSGYCASSMSGFPPDPAYHTTEDVVSNYDWSYFMTAARSAAAVVAAWAYRWTD